MMHTSVQYTPLQVLQAARRAEAEGKMDYALQFYRHIVENHATTPEAQESREGLIRIAEWRWSDARGGRRQDYAGAQGGNQRHVPPPPSERPEHYHESVDAQPAMGSSAHLPQIIAREAARAAEGAEPAAEFAARYRSAKIIAQLLSGLGWASVAAGLAVAIVAAAGTNEIVSAAALMGLPLGVVIGTPAALIGLVLVVTGHLAVAVFESTNATLELLSIERGRTT